MVKRSLDRQVAYGKDVANADDVYNIILNCVKSVKCYYIKTEHIVEISKLLPPTIKTIPGTRSIHQIVTLNYNQIKHRILSCFCSLDDCFCFNSKIHKFEIAQSSMLDIPNVITPINGRG